MTNKQINNTQGFTLVEILVVIVIMGLVVASIYSLFIDSKRTSQTSEEVVDVQQNLRVAVETLVADIRMAGFLTPPDQMPLESAPTSLSTINVLDLNICTSTRVYARVIDDPGEISAGSETNISVDTEMAQNFSTDDGIRIINPLATNHETVLTAAEVTGVDAATDKIKIKPSGTIKVEKGDMFALLKDVDDDAFPTLIRYQLADDPDSSDTNMKLLQRSINGNAFQTIASKISSINLSYLMADGTERNNTTDFAADDFKAIRAVRINISAQTDNTQTGQTNYSGVKTRSLQTVATIQNAFGE